MECNQNMTTQNLHSESFIEVKGVGRIWLNKTISHWINTYAQKHDIAKNFFIRAMLTELKDTLPEDQIDFIINHYKETGKIGKPGFYKRPYRRKTK